MNFYILLFLTAFFSSMLILNVVKVYGQANETPLRYTPKLNEDQFIVCVTDYKHEQYRGQLSCKIIEDQDQNRPLRSFYNDAVSLKDTFELGLID